MRHKILIDYETAEAALVALDSHARDLGRTACGRTVEEVERKRAVAAEFARRRDELAEAMGDQS